MKHTAAVAAWALFAACASGPLTSNDVADGITTLAVVTLLDDDLALLDGERMPLDAAILRLRWRVRAMSPAELASFGVRIVEAADLPESAESRVMTAKGRLLDQLDVMEVPYAKQ